MVTEKFRPAEEDAATRETGPSAPPDPDAHREDLHLMALVAAGDPDASRQLADRLVSRVHRLARSILRAPADADDAAQQSLIEILTSAKSYRGGSSIERWSDRIAVRTTMRLARERRKLAGRLDDAVELDEIVSAAPGPASSDAAPRLATEYLNALPEKQRNALVLRHVMDYSIAEIAELTETSPNTVKDRLLRGAREMRKLIRRDLALGTGKKGAAS
jgi:RNA polymerase sigma-70 factor, ECF subfamily